MRALQTTALLAAIALLTAGPSAQGLADVARRTPAAPQTAAKKYTNDDVETAKPVAAPAPAAGVAAAPEAPKAETTKATAGASTQGSQEEPAGEASEKKKPAEYVVNRIAALKALLQNKEKQLTDAQARDAKRDAEAIRAQMVRAQAELSALETRLP
jgi:hypothetical protein